MPRWVGLLGSWALFVLGLGLTTVAVAGEWINSRDSRRLERVRLIDQLIAERTGNKAEVLRQTAGKAAAHVTALQTQVEGATRRTEEVPDTDQTIVISTAENKIYVRRGAQTVFEAVCSTGSGSTMALDGKTLVFDTPIGKLKVLGKEENPVWVPPDWHYVEQARKSGMEVVRLNRGSSIDASTGGPAQKAEEGVWSWLGGSSGSSRVLKVRGNTVVEVSNGYERELPPGSMIVAGGSVVIPPIGTKQRQFDKVLGRYRLNLGDGYAIHGTQETAKLGTSVSHGCVRVGDADIERLHQIANVGDEVIIY